MYNSGGEFIVPGVGLLFAVPFSSPPQKGKGYRLLGGPRRASAW